MKFLYTEDLVTLADGDTSYILPTEDIERLLMRPGTRVLRMIDKEGEIISRPLSQPVGEIEGYDLLITHFKKD